MRLTVELSAEEWEALATDDRPITQPVEAVVVRQGVLEEERRAAYVDRLSPGVAFAEGIETTEPVLRVWLRTEEAPDGNDD